MPKAGEKWAIDCGDTGKDISLRVVLNTSTFPDYASKFDHNELEIEFMTELLEKLKPFAPGPVEQMKKKLKQDLGKPKRFSIDSLERKVSFPRFTPTNKPGRAEYRISNNEVARLAKDHGIKPGEYEGENAVEVLNKLRDVVLGSLNKKVGKFSTETSLPLLIESLDALADERDLKRSGHKLAADRDVDFDLHAAEAESQSEFAHFSRCTIYLIEKMVALKQASGAAMTSQELKSLLSLVDRLLEIYSVSSVIRYKLVTTLPKLKITHDYLVELEEAPEVSSQEDELNKEQASIRLSKINVPTVALIDETKERANINKAFLDDFEFEFENMGAALSVLSEWGNRDGTGDKAFYSEDRKTLIEKLQKQFTTPVKTNELEKIIDFLTLDESEILKLLGSSAIQADVPVWEHKKRSHRYTIRPLTCIKDRYYWGPYSALRAIGIWQDNAITGNEPYALPEGSKLKGTLERIKALKEKEIEHKALQVLKGITKYAEKTVALHKRDRSGGHPEALGDYDVLAWIPESNLLVNLEAKYVVRAQTHRDAFTQTEYYFDDTKSQKYLTKVENRAEHLNQNAGKVIAAMGWPKPTGSVKIISIIVANHLYQWMRYPLRKTSVTFMDIERLVLWADKDDPSKKKKK